MTSRRRQHVGIESKPLLKALQRADGSGHQSSSSAAGALPGGRAGYPRPHPPPIPPAWPRRADPASSCSVPGAAELAKSDAEGSGGRNWDSGTPVQAAQEMLLFSPPGTGGSGGESHQKGGWSQA